MIIILVVILILSLLMYVIGKGKYKARYADLGKKEFPLRDLMVIGKVMLDIVPERVITFYSEYVIEYIHKYYGRNKGGYYFEAHIAKKFAYIAIINLIIPMYLNKLQFDIVRSIFLIIIADSLIFYLGDRELKEKCLKMDQSVKDQLPDILDKLGIMISVNISPVEAFREIQKDLPEGVLKKEINRLLVDIENGCDYKAVFQSFSSALRIREVSKLSTLIISYYRTGSSNIIDKFDNLALESFMMRKRNAKIKGEQTSIKLVLPIMLFFISLILMIIVPGVVQINKLI